MMKEKQKKEREGGRKEGGKEREGKRGLGMAVPTCDPRFKG